MAEAETDLQLCEQQFRPVRMPDHTCTHCAVRKSDKRPTQGKSQKNLVSGVLRRFPSLPQEFTLYILILYEVQCTVHSDSA